MCVCMCVVGWLVGWFGLVLRHIKICRLFNAKSIFMILVLIQFAILKKKTSLFQGINFSQTILFIISMQLVLFSP